MENEESKKGFKVNDKRRFDESGQEKQVGSDQTTEAKIAQQKKVEPVNQDTNFELKEPEFTGSQELNFSSFVVSLATQALMQLGEIPVPEGMSIPKDKEAAKQTIDILSILKNKTQGNLDASEARLMEEILHNLRMAFVQK